MDRDALKLLAQSSVRRLFALRHGPHGADARKACRQWLRTLRAYRRKYHVVAVYDRTGRANVCTRYPEPHDQACSILRRFNPYPGRRMMLAEFWRA